MYKNDSDSDDHANNDTDVDNDNDANNDYNDDIDDDGDGHDDENNDTNTTDISWNDDDHGESFHYISHCIQYIKLQLVSLSSFLQTCIQSRACDAGSSRTNFHTMAA